MNDPAKLQALAEKSYALPRAMRRLYLGEDPAKLVIELLPLYPSMTVQQLIDNKRAWPSLEIVDRYLAKDPVARFRESNDRLAGDLAKQEHLRSVIRDRAAAAGISYDDAAEAFAAELIRELPIRILDDRFHLRRGREMFR